MPTCREVSRAVAAGEVEVAGVWRRIGIRLHLLLCRHCRRYAAQLRALGEAAGQALSEEAEDRARIARLCDAILGDSPPADDLEPEPEIPPAQEGGRPAPRTPESRSGSDLEPGCKKPAASRTHGT